MFNMVSQVQDGKYCLMTWLEQYKVNPITAPPYLTMVFFDELLASKDLLLFRADVIAGDISKPVASKVIKYLTDFYLDAWKYQDVSKFNHNPQEFDYSDFQKRHAEFF